MIRALVTGAGGFIGSHLVELLVENDFAVRAFVHYNAKGNWGWLEESPCKDDVEVIAGDVRDYDSVHRAMKDCDTVFHLAALIGIPYSYESPLAYIRTNVEGTYNVLEAARQRGTSQVLVTSTSETYGTAQQVPINEAHPLVGQSPYAATKIAADQLAISFHRSFGLPVKIVRPFNTYGPRQSARAIVPAIICQILSGEKVLLLGNVYPTRDLTFVKDTARGFLEIFRADVLLGEVTNIGMNEETSVGDLAALIARIMEVQVEVHTDKQRVRPELSEVERLRCDNGKLVALTGWKARYNLQQGLEETIRSVREHANLYKSELYNV